MTLLWTTILGGGIAAGGAAYAVHQWRRDRFARLLRHGGAVQLAADGQLALAGLRQRDSAFDAEQFLERAAEFQERFYAAWTARDLTPVQGVMLPGFRDRILLEVDMHRALLRNLEVFDVSVADAEVVEAVQDGVFDTVYVRLSGDAMRRTMHGSTNRWLSGGVTPEPFEEVWGFVRRSDQASRQAPGTLEGFCPGCGADMLESPGNTVCHACGAVLEDGSRDWAVAYRGSAEAWRPSDVPPPEAASEADTLSRLADRVTGLFWRMRAATLHADESLLRDQATPAFLAEHLSEFRPAREGRHVFFALPELGRIEWSGFSEERAWLRVHWRGIPVQARVPSFAQDDPDRLAPYVDDYVLERSEEDGAPWKLAAIHRVTGAVPCPELLDELQETRRLDRLPVMTRCEREALVQLCVVLLLRQGPLQGRRLANLKAAGGFFGVTAARLPVLIRQVESEGAVLFGSESKLPPEVLFRHLARIAMAGGTLRPPVLALLRDVARALAIEPQRTAVLRSERALLLDAVARIDRARRRRGRTGGAAS